MSEEKSTGQALGAYLRDRRTRLDPAALGMPLKRRRTPGLRREEVAQRACVSATWYTWLEQGRGGAPSADLLERLAAALLLTDIEREHLFLLGLGHPPEPRYSNSGGVSPRLQRILDAFELSPALIKTPTWDVLAWNRAATVVLTDYGKLEPSERNILRLIFRNSRVREAQEDWEAVAYFAVAAFRADAARLGSSPEVKALVEELSRSSAEFAALWKSHEVIAYGEGSKRLRHPIAGDIALEYSAFHVDGRPDLSMVVYTPATDQDTNKVKALLQSL